MRDGSRSGRASSSTSTPRFDLADELHQIRDRLLEAVALVDDRAWRAPRPCLPWTRSRRRHCGRRRAHRPETSPDPPLVRFTVSEPRGRTHGPTLLMAIKAMPRCASATGERARDAKCSPSLLLPPTVPKIATGQPSGGGVPDGEHEVEVDVMCPECRRRAGARADRQG